MKRSTLLLAMLSLSSALYAQPASSALTREQVLEVFSRFNPVVLEKAGQDETYRVALEQFLSSYSGDKTPADPFEIVAAARNFENSLYLNQLTNLYRDLWLASKMMGTDIQPTRQLFMLDVRDVFANSWAVTVQLRQYQLEQTQHALRQLRNNKSLPKQALSEQQQLLKQGIKLLKAEINAFKKNPGERVVALAQNYVTQVENQAREESFSVKQKTAEQASLKAGQSENLQVKSKHKKPVAK